VVTVDPLNMEEEAKKEVIIEDQEVEVLKWVLII
jgi:hypothetical protein